MAVTATPIFTQTPKHVGIIVPTLNAGRDGTGTITTIVTAGSNGSKILVVTFQMIVTSTAGMARLFMDDSGGANSWLLFDEHPITAITASGSVAAFRKAVSYENLLLTAGAQLGASNETGEDFICHVDYGDF